MAKKPSQNKKAPPPIPPLRRNNGRVQKPPPKRGPRVPPPPLRRRHAGTAAMPMMPGLPPFPGFYYPQQPHREEDKTPCLPTPGVNYLIDDISLLVLLQIKPRIPDDIVNSGTFLCWNVESTEDDFQRIQRYFNNSKGGDYVKIKNILRITRVGDLEPNGLEHGPRKMLFHGTSSQNIGSILKTGFLPGRSNYGGGIFFADRVAKSLMYCRDYDYFTGGSRCGWLFLCEVFLGRGIQNSNWNLQLPWGYNSVERKGSQVPDAKEDITVSECVWPLGKTVNGGSGSGYGAGGIYRGFGFLHNEYIVYRPEQARPKFLIEWERTG